jgi:mercuric ion binding protein
MKVRPFMMTVYGMLLLMGLLISSIQAATLATETIILSVTGMTCAVCPITVRKSLQKIPGVKEVNINFKAKTAIVIFNPTQTNIKALISATTKAGYPSIVINNTNLGRK